MRNITYLTKRDLAYFEKLEKEGEAVILEIEPEKLIDLDLDELFPEEDKDRVLTLDEVRKILGLTEDTDAQKREMESISDPSIGKDKKKTHQPKEGGDIQKWSDAAGIIPDDGVVDIQDVEGEETLSEEQLKILTGEEG